MGEIRFETRLDCGIERVICRPSKRAHATPILFQHGMWHAAWCWRDWQMHFAEKGWESHAISLPGHGRSQTQKETRLCTMNDYLDTLRSEIAQFPDPPILVGHSMGGALAQWYLKKVADNFPAVVMVASWTAHSTIADGTLLHLMRDPWGFLKSGFTRSSTPLVRSPRRAASLLITEGATISR